MKAQFGTSPGQSQRNRLSDATAGPRHNCGLISEIFHDSRYGCEAAELREPEPRACTHRTRKHSKHAVEIVPLPLGEQSKYAE